MREARGKGSVVATRIGRSVIWGTKFAKEGPDAASQSGELRATRRKSQGWHRSKRARMAVGATALAGFLGLAPGFQPVMAKRVTVPTASYIVSIVDTDQSGTVGAPSDNGKVHAKLG